MIQYLLTTVRKPRTWRLTKSSLVTLKPRLTSHEPPFRISTYYLEGLRDTKTEYRSVSRFTWTSFISGSITRTRWNLKGPFSFLPHNIFPISIIMLHFLTLSAVVKNVCIKGWLPEMTAHTEVFAPYCLGWDLSDHPVVMCGRRLTSRQLPKELESAMEMHLASSARCGI